MHIKEILKPILSAIFAIYALPVLYATNLTQTNQIVFSALMLVGFYRTLDRAEQWVSQKLNSKMPKP